MERSRERYRRKTLEQATAAIIHVSEDDETIEISRALFDILARHSIDHAAMWHSIGGLGDLLGVMMLPEFRAALSPELQRHIDKTFPPAEVQT